MADLTIYVDVREVEPGKFQTMSHYKVPKSDKIIFVNAAPAGTGELTLKLKAPTTELLCANDGKTEKPFKAIADNYGKDEFKVCNKYLPNDFLYTAQIGNALPEDPIVIIEKKAKFVFDPGSFALGAGIAAILVYLILRSRAGRTRPQQG
jgi:hypothetical protein